MRRTTLGGLSSSQANARATDDGGGAGTVKSAHPGRKSLGGFGGASRRASVGGGARQSLSGRPSLSGAGGPARSTAGKRDSGVRRSGAFGKGSGARSDPRPVGDKAFQSACIRTLITYLTGHGFDHAISPKLLGAPTAKEFTHIAQFLFRKMDPNVKFVTKFEDEVPMLFKRAGYPFQISKSALQAVGSPHTWPGLLAALAWLVELLTYEERAEETKSSAFDEDGQKVFFEYVGQSYTFFLCGDDAACERLDEELAQTFAERDHDAKADVARLEQANEQLQEEIAQLKSKVSPLADLQKKRADFLSDVDKFNKLIANLEAHKETLQLKLAERQKDLLSKQTELHNTHAEIEDLRERVGRQSVNASDVEQMNKERTHLEEVLEATRETKEREEKKVWDHEVEAERRLRALEDSVREYHTRANALQLMPVSAKRANGIVYELGLNTAGNTVADILSVDLKGEIKPGLVALKEEYTQKTRQVQEGMLEAQEQLVTSKETLSERSEAREAAEVAAIKAETVYKQERERMEAEVSKQMCEADELENEVINTKSAYKDELNERELQYRDVQEEFEVQSATHAKEKADASQAVLGALDLLMVHKQKVQDLIGSVSETCQGYLQEVEELGA